MGGGFTRLPPIPHGSICFFNPGHYPGPWLLEIRSGSIDRRWGLLGAANEAGWCAQKAPLPMAPAPPSAPGCPEGGPRGLILPVTGAPLHPLHWVREELPG